ncbi:MAG: tRNA (guanosine(37)-N1)-methyltransferase TrmD [Terracidiphilus sp.]|jgi:tRNA (guanine37-N1)-methyltransferase
MRFDIVTIFPGFFESVFAQGIVRRAQTSGLVEIRMHDLRDFTHDRHRTVDDRPFGGGEGMVLKPEPLAEALETLGVRPRAERESSKSASRQVSESASQPESSEERNAGPSTPIASAISAQDDRCVKGTRVILLSAQGRVFTQAVARELAALERVVLVCGRYEGVDERVNELYCDMELSIGDYVLSGGEPAAVVVVDATMRLIPGVLGNEASGEFESFGAADAEIDVDVEGVPRSQHGAGGLLDYPHYTRPAEFGGLRAPEVLMNGDHAQIRRWRREQQLKKTLKNRPELLERAALSVEDRRMLEAMEKTGSRE